MGSIKSKQKRKEKIINIVITCLIIVSALLLVGYIWYDSHKIKTHVQDCVKTCHPDEVVESLSNDICVCKKVVHQPKDMI